MRSIAVLVFGCSIAWAGQSLQLASGVSGSIIFPESSPFLRADQANASMRFEFRLHDFSAPGGTRTIWQASGNNFYCSVAPSLDLTCTDWFDVLDDSNSAMSLAGRTDVIVRVVRDTVKGQFWVEMQNVDSTGYVRGQIRKILNAGNGPSSGSGTLRIWAMFIPGDDISARLAWLRWRPDAVAPGSAMPQDSDSVTGSWSAWEFEGNGKDSSGYGNDFALANATYATTRTYPPACDAGVRQTFRAGAPAVLDGSRSAPLNNNTALSYLWQQISGPSVVTWTNHKSVNASVSGLVFGSYVFQLTVTDSDGVFSTCSIKHGAVATDANGVIIVSNPDHAKFFGSASAGPSGAGGALRYGLNPWSYYDAGQTRMADTIVSVIDTHFASAIDTPSSGTITLNNGCNTGNYDLYGNPTCATVTGSGTHFQTDFCGGPGNTAPVNVNPGDAGARELTTILIWYRSTLFPGMTGRRAYPIRSCDSETQLTLGRYNQNESWSWVTDPEYMDPDTTGLQYSRWDPNTSYWWQYNSAPANYYDNVVALYLTYYRTGIDDYRDTARKLADRWWRIPKIDRGAVYGPNSGYFSFAEQRCFSLAGMMLRALDGKPDMWPGIRRMIRQRSGDITIPGPLGDLRNSGYQMMWTAMAAIFDPDTTPVTGGRATVWQMVQTSVANKWKPYRQPEGVWEVGVGGGYSWGGTGQVYTGTANVVNGSTTVSGSGTNFTYTWNNGYEGCQTAGVGGWIWFAPMSSTSPYSSTGGHTGEKYAYRIASVNSDTSITLVRPYAGATGARNYACTPADGWLATGIQPFMLGLAGQGLWWARQAAVFNGDATLADTLSTYVQGIGNWIKDVAYIPSTGGVYYGRIFPPCESDTDRPDSCISHGDGEGATRINTAESFHAYTMLYSLAPSPALRDLIDARYGVLYGKPGTNAPVEDSRYLDALETYWLDPNSLYTPKWFGFLYGIGANWSWPAARLGGLSAPETRSLKTSIRFADHPKATQARVTVSDPQGNLTQTICTSSPCTFAADARQGDHTLKVDLLNAASAVVLAGEQQILKLR